MCPNMGKRDYRVAIGCILLTLFADAACQAKKIAAPAPKLRVGWVLAPNLAFIRLTIMNEGDRSVAVDPQMGFLLSKIANDPRIRLLCLEEAKRARSRQCLQPPITMVCLAVGKSC